MQSTAIQERYDRYGFRREMWIQPQLLVRPRPVRRAFDGIGLRTNRQDVRDDIASAIRKRACGTGRKRTVETLNKLQRGDVTLAAYDAAGKQEAINGEAGPDYDEPA